jgi:dTDP-4-amino-4,6-dideoxygalactose transaminase
MLVINDKKFAERAEIIWEKGTNRSAFFRGEVDKYSWVDIGSSFLPSEIVAAFLWAQLENLEDIQKVRTSLWENYYQQLQDWSFNNEIQLPVIPSYATNNGHMFYIVCKNVEQRASIINTLRSKGILSVFHYISLHGSEFYKNNASIYELKQTDKFSDCLLRLPMYYELDTDSVINKLVSKK